ncbi:hypothetical protein I317_02457 [Kwoniella heveanensis CBS 569]|nr:hypothetical protein I317_02457 [Kwoniella heveanensis CBS 569]
MENSIRRPLGVSRASNIPAPQISTPHICKTRKAEIRKALAETADHHHHLRPNSDVFGPALMGGEDDDDEVEELKRNLEKARARLERRDERIINLEAQLQRKTNSHSLGIERKLEDLVLQHVTSKNKYHAELETLRSENQKLQQSLSSHLKETADLRRKSDLIDKENTNLKREIASLQHSQTHSNEVASASRKEIKELEDERTTWKAEKHRLEREVAQLQVEVQHARKQQKEGREATHAEKEEMRRLRQDIARLKVDNDAFKEESSGVRETEEENDRLQNLLSASAAAYRLLHKHSVSKNEYQELEERYLLAKGERDQWRSETFVKHRQISSLGKQVAALHHQIEVMGDERETLESMVEDLLKDREALRNDMSTMSDCLSSTVGPLYEIEDSIKADEYSQLLALGLSHIDMQSSHLLNQLDDIWEDHAPLRSAHDKVQTSLNLCQHTLSTLQRSMAELEAKHISLESQHSSCTSTIISLIRQSKDAQDTAKSLRVEMAKLREEMVKVESKAREDREALKRVNEVFSRSKTAEAVLDEEVQHLREAYIAAAQYEDLYNDLKEEQALITAREEVAIREAERLGLENAELAGHTNEGQKINYVEGLRREMFGVKQVGGAVPLKAFRQCEIKKVPHM